MMEMSKLEIDFFGDIAQAPHDLWEVYQFVRYHHPGASEKQVLRIGRELLTKWVERGWLRAFPEMGALGPVLSGDEILTFIDKVGAQAATPQRKTIRLDLTEKAHREFITGARGEGDGVPPK